MYFGLHFLKFLDSKGLDSAHNYFTHTIHFKAFDNFLGTQLNALE
jgi:hypothetical protein